jgi:hypothetical protein
MAYILSTNELRVTLGSRLHTEGVVSMPISIQLE